MEKIKSGICKSCVYWSVCGTKNRTQLCEEKITFAQLNRQNKRTNVRK